MRCIFLVTSLCLMVILGACSSPETEELVDYHNSYNETVNEKAEEVDQLLVKADEATTVTEAYNILQVEVKPLVDEITKYILDQKPETDAVKELNNMRIKQFKGWSEAFDIQLEALEISKQPSADEEEVAVLMEKYNTKLSEATKIGEKANEKFKNLADEYNVELTDFSDSN